MKRTPLTLLGIFLAAIGSIVAQKKQINVQRIIKQILEFRETNNKNTSAFFTKLIWDRPRLNTASFKMNHPAHVRMGGYSSIQNHQKKVKNFCKLIYEQTTKR